MKKLNETAEEIIPKQKTGSQTGATAVITLNNRAEAIGLFKKARARLLDVNKWGEYSGIASASFELTDATGNPGSGMPQIGDLIRIDLPGPGTIAGKGFDWVCIEEIADNSNPDAEDESFALRVRPVQSPFSKDHAPAHFYTREATSTFVIERNGNHISASEKGRNEKLNTEAESIIDKVRNAVVGTGARNGLAYPQWKSLMEGLLN